MLRAAAGHYRMVHSMRCSPPTAQKPAFADFDSALRSAFSNLTGLHLDGSQWAQAARGFGQAGLGLRSTLADAPAAYLASVGGCADLCAAVDPGFDTSLLSGRADVLAALADFNIAGTAGLTASTTLSLSQKSLTKAADNAAWEHQLAASTITACAILRSEAEEGVRAFLAAVPVARRRLEPAIFIAELRHRLGIADAADDAWCPRCDAILDRFSLHAGVCSAGGERTLRHRTLRDVLFTWLDRAGLQPEREKPGLLLPQRPEDHGLARRRPADLFVPAYLGSPVAFDLAVTGPQRQESLGAAARQGLAAAVAYAEVKVGHLNTAQVCREQGVRFVPLVVETTGVWEPQAAKVLVHVARAAVVREGSDPSTLHAELTQDLCATIRSFRARAALRRRAELATEASGAAARLAAAALMTGWEVLVGRPRCFLNWSSNSLPVNGPHGADTTRGL